MSKKIITKEQFDTLCDLLDVALGTNNWCRARSEEERKDMKVLNRLGLVARMDATKKSGEKESFWKCQQKGAEYIVKNWVAFYPNEPTEYSFNEEVSEEEIPQLKLVVS